jgi:hypothetical protein
MDVVYATSTVRVGTRDGSPVTVPKGSHWPADDPIVADHPDIFSADPRWGLLYSQEPDGYRDQAPVEQATRAPGEKRQTRRGGAA